MKKIYFIFIGLISFVSFGQTIYSENMGTPSGNTTVAAYTSGTAPATFQNGAPIAYTGTSSANMMRVSSASTGYTGASGSGNVFFAAAGGQFFQIAGLNTAAFSSADLQLSFGYLTTTTSAQMVVETSTDGTVWTPLTFTNNSTTSWNLVTIGAGQIPASATLQLRFTAPVTGSGMRVDDVKIANVSASCTLSLGTPVAVCNASTLALDSYTVTIPYTGGGTASYTITPSSGVVGGDNPNSVAAGNIIISGVTEGTAFSATITGGTCNLSTNANSPECKPVNTLPLNEPFNYTAGNSLGGEQMWTNVNTGDNVTVASGNLSYTGITSTGNSITFAGTGVDVRTPFTSTNSGTIYASFIVTVSDLANITADLTNTYFAFFTDATGATTTARIWIRKNGTQYQFGLSPNTSAPTNWSPNLHNANDIQYLVLGYDFGTNLLSFYENPAIGGTASSTLSVTPAAAFANLGGFMFRQEAANTTPTMIIDELTVNTTPNFTLGAASFSQIDGLKMYPNPTKNNLFIETALNGDINVSIVNMLGKEVVNTNVVNNTVNVSNLTSGIYIVKITEEGKTSTKKLIIE